MNFRFAAALLCLVSAATDVNPGYKFELTKKGLDLATRAGGDAVTQILKTTKIPPFKGDDKRATLEVKNIAFKEFRGERWFYALKPPSTMTFGLSGAALELNADFKGKTHVLFLPSISVSGKIKVKVNNLALSISNSLHIDAGGRPIVKAVDCKATLGSFNIKLSGSTAAWIAQMFHKVIEAQLKPKIGQAICANAKKTISSNLGDQIEKTIPSPIPIHGDFAFSYRLEQIQVSPKSIGFAGEGAIVYKGDVSKTKDPPKLITDLKRDRMGYFYLSDHVLNSVGRISHDKGLLKLQANKDMLPMIEPFLRTQCTGSVCVGAIITELAQRYPNKTCAVNVVTNAPPMVLFSSDGIHVSLDIGIALSVYSGQGKVEKPFALAKVKGSADLKAKTSKSHVNASFTLNSFDVYQTHSSLSEPVNWEFIQNYGKQLFGVQLKQILDKGIELPAVKGVKLLNPGVITHLHTLELSTDLEIVK